MEKSVYSVQLKTFMFAGFGFPAHTGAVDTGRIDRSLWN